MYNSFQVLADVFESLMGAVYIDSGHSLSSVWAVYSKLFPNLEAVIENPVSTHDLLMAQNRT